MTCHSLMRDILSDPVSCMALVLMIVGFIGYLICDILE